MTTARDTLAALLRECPYIGANAVPEMGVEWMNRHEVREAVPPVYTDYIGRELLRVLSGVLSVSSPTKESE